MANLVFPKFLQQLLTAVLNGVTVKMLAVNTVTGTTYTYSSAHTFVSDVTAGAIVGRSAALTSLSFGDGVFDAADLAAAWASLTGVQFEAVLFYIDTGSDATSRLMAYFDTVTGLPLTPNGNNVDAAFNAGGIFTI
jgi:hypothetical protein